MTTEDWPPTERVVGDFIEVTRHPITVVATTRRGKRKLLSIEWAEYENHGKHGEWWLKMDWTTVRPSERFPDDAEYHGDLLRNEFRLAGRGEKIPIGRDVDVPLVVLRVICDALRLAGLHEVDVDDIKTVVSQCGARILTLDDLPAEQRRHAEALLHRQIVNAVVTSERQ